VVFLTLAAGSTRYVVLQLVGRAAKAGERSPLYLGVFAGLAVGSVTRHDRHRRRWLSNHVPHPRHRVAVPRVGGTGLVTAARGAWLAHGVQDWHMGVQDWRAS